MYILDAIIVIIFILGIMWGIRNGVIKSTVSLLGTILCLIIAFTFKNSLSSVFYKNLPFFELNGVFEGVSVINIVIYELIAFLVIFILCNVILKVLIKVTGIIEKIFKLTIVLGFFSKMLGAVVGFIQSYIIVFIFLFIFTQPFITIIGIEDSWLSDKILNSTFLLSDSVKNTRDAINEIYELNNDYKNDKKLYNKKALELLVDYDIIDEGNVKILKEKGKLGF